MTSHSKEKTILRIVEISGFTVIGIEARTNNGKEATADGIIGRLWHRFIDDAMTDRMPDKSGSSLYAVYSEYASDHNGEYTFTVGAPVKAQAAVPQSMVRKPILGGKYAVITTPSKGRFRK